ncbi:MAG: hypothetical protein EP348_09885, partial [Alphaproteobacteria bacterium]
MLNAEELETPHKNPSEGVKSLLNGRFRVDFSAPLEFLNNGMNQAFRAIDEQNADADIFAIAASPYSLPRKALITAMEMSPFKNQVDLRARGPVRFGETDVREIFIFDMPGGGGVMTGGPVPERRIVDIILPSIAEALTSLHATNMAHRGIRADNIFYEDALHKRVLLGEAVTTAPGAAQPAVYEPLESANAHPFGRGDGDPASDLYAVGVLILHLLTGELPAKDLNTEELYLRKLEMGSFGFLAAHLHLSQRTGDLLRGLLQDDPARRWDAEMLTHWRSAATDVVAQGMGDRRTSQKIRFDGGEFVSPRLLSHALTKNPREACNLLSSGKLQSWIRNALRDNEAGEEIAFLEQMAADNSRGLMRSETALVAQINSLLNVRGTYWYRELSFARSGLGGLLAYAFYEDSTSMKGMLADLMESGLLLKAAIHETGGSGKGKRTRGWIAHSRASNCFDHMKQKKNPGFGLERCLYELNPSMSCLSPIVLDANVKNMKQFLDVIEIKLMKSGGKSNPFDRHCAAFIAVKSNGCGKFFNQIGNSSPASIPYTIALIKLFSVLQRY